MDEAIEKGWNRIHFHSCDTSVNFKYLEIGQFLRAVITGFKNQISAEKEPSSTADSYLLKGCPQISIDKKIRCLVQYCVLSNGNKKFGTIKKRQADELQI
jgi:hypothetical protein